MAGSVREVATTAGVSPATVSRAFSRPELISPETRNRVLVAARQVGYTPRSTHAGRLARTGSIGLVVPDIANPFFPPLIKAAQNRALRSDLTVLLADTDEDPEIERRVVGHVVRQVAGVLLCSSRLSADTIREMTAQTRLVLVNRVVEGVPSVLIDTGEGMRQAVDHLAALGHRSVVYLSGPSSSWSNEQRCAGLRSQAREREMTVQILGPYISNFEAGVQAADSAAATEATAVVAYDDVMAFGVLARLDDRGFRVPGDVSVVGCDNVPAAAVTRPRLTTVTARCDVAGRVAVDLLADLIAGTGSDSATTVLPTQLLIRDSTGPMPERRPHCGHDGIRLHTPNT